MAAVFQKDAQNPKSNDDHVDTNDSPTSGDKPTQTSHERLKRVKPSEDFQVELVTTLQALHQVFRLRYDVFCVQLEALCQNEQGLEIDRYDADASHFSASINGEAVAAARIIPPINGKFPMELDDGFVVPAEINRATTEEVSRICSRPLANRIGWKATVDVMKCAYDWSISRGKTHWVYCANSATITFLKRNRFYSEPIGEPRTIQHGKFVDTFHPLIIPLHERGRFSWFE